MSQKTKKFSDIYILEVEESFSDKEKEAEKFLKSLEKDQKQVKSKSISFKCTLEDYTLIRAKAILKGISIAEFLVELARKEKVKGYDEAKEDLKKIFEQKGVKMTEKQSSKTVSIRTKQDTEELFKSIAKDFASQDEAFRSLIAAYDREHKKDDLSEHRDAQKALQQVLKAQKGIFQKFLKATKKQKIQQKLTLQMRLTS